jgi:hypothetical protein
LCIDNFITMMVLFFYIVIFLIQIVVFRLIPGHFCSDLSIFDGSDFTDRILFLTFPFLLLIE